MNQSPLSEEDVFKIAREIPAVDARMAYLHQACGDDVVLRQRVAALLRVAEEEQSFLEKPAAGYAPTVAGSALAEQPGAQIGPYKLLEQIGEGGFGVVFMAEQQQPVRRKVALKVLKAGMDTRQVIARFEAERQALALMDHPNIARVFDAGETASGRPYFVMELVKGIPITQFCDDAQLTTRERLELFVSLCQAIQHAHQKGVIHRDVKPTNVLVTLHDGTPVVKVIDFGVAKATGQQLTEKTLFTGFAQMVGTPLYMSPEQAALSGLDIDTRSDVYSLGVLLYELLTGTTPLAMECLRQAAFDEVRRLIREEEPVKPSTRVSTLGATAMSISALRKTEPRKLSQLLRNELDWIVMKALEKDRSRRYETASAFAADVGRYLRDEQVEACPPSTLYRFRKLARRHRIALTSGVLVGAALLSGVAVSTSMAIVASRQRDRAERATSAELTQRRAADAARQAETDQRTIAERERDEAQRQRDRVSALNTSLQRQQERQRRTLYVARLNLIQKAWDSDNLARVRELLNATRPGPGEEDLRGFEWNYWQRRMHADERAVKLPIDVFSQASDVDFSHDGKQIAVISGTPSVVKVWDTASGKQRFEKAIPPDVDRPKGTEYTFRVAYVDSDRVAVTVGRRQSDATRSSRLGAGNARIHVFRFDTGEEMFAKEAAFSGNLGPGDPFVFSRDGSRVAASLPEPFVQVWDGTSGQEIAKVAVPSIPGASRLGEILALSPNGSKLAIKPGVMISSGTPYQGITVADVGADKTVTTPPLRAQQLDFSPDGTRLAAMDPLGLPDDSRVTVFDTATGRQLYGLINTAPPQFVQGRSSLLPTQQFSPDGRWFAFTTMRGWGNGTLQLWNAATGQAGPEFKGYSSAPRRIAFSADGTQFLSAHQDGAIITWPVPAPAAMPTDRVASIQKRRWVWNSPDGRWSASMPFGPALPVPESAEIEAVLAELRLEDATGRIASRAFPLVGEESSAIFSSNSAYLVAVGVKKQGELSKAAELKVWEVATGRELLSLRMPATEIQQGGPAPRIPWINSSHVAFSPDCQRLVIAVPDELEKDRPPSLRIQVWDLDSGRELLPRDKRPALAFPSNRLEFKSDGGLLFSLPRPIPAGSFDRTYIRHLLADPSAPLTGLQVWESSTGRLLWEDPRPISAVASDEGSYVAGIVDGAGQQQAVIWEARSGKKIAKCPWDGNQLLTDLAVTRDGSRVALSSEKEVTVFDPAVGIELFTLSGHAGEILALAFSSDGKRIATSAGERKSSGRFYFSQDLDEARDVKVWDTSTGQELLALEATSGGLAAGPLAGGVALELTSHALRVANGPVWDAAPLALETSMSELLEASRNVVQQPGRLAETYEPALRYLKEACEIDPSSREAWSLRALAHYRLGQPTEALAALARSHELHDAQKLPRSAEDLTTLAMVRHQAGQREQAQSALEQARVCVSRDERAWEQLLSEAETLLAVPKAADAPERWIGRKVMPRRRGADMTSQETDRQLPFTVLRVDGDRLRFGLNSIPRTIVLPLEDASRYYSNLIQAEPDRWLGYNYRGIVWENLGEFDKAFEDYSAAIRLSPGNAALYMNRAHVWAYKKHELDKGLADFDEALRRDPSYARAHVERGNLRLKQGEPDDALKNLDEAIRLKPDLGFAYSCRAYIWSVKGDRAKMLHDLDEGIRRTPDDSQVWNLQAWLLATSPNAEHRDGKQAVAAATKACELTAWLDGQALDSLAAACAETGDFAKAIQWEEKAIAQTLSAERVDFETRLKLYREGKPYRELAKQPAGDKSPPSTKPAQP